MQIVIDIPEQQYYTIQNLYDTFPAEMKQWGLGAIKNGTPLPKGHGRLIDADELIKSLTPDPILECGCPEPEYLGELIELLNNAPTIIEGEV